MMSRKTKPKSQPMAEQDPGAVALDRLTSLARRYPKVTESLEFALEVGILAAQARKQISTGVREGTREVAHRHAVPKVPRKDTRAARR
jgi:hypothetical protein